MFKDKILIYIYALSKVGEPIKLILDIISFPSMSQDNLGYSHVVESPV
jgi:hypothetical protein